MHHVDLNASYRPADWPEANDILTIKEPWIEATIYVPDEYLGAILKLCQDRRGIQKNLTYVGTGAHQRAMAHGSAQSMQTSFSFATRRP